MNGMTVPGSFDSLIAKIIITGANRKQALQRSRRPEGTGDRGHADRGSVPSGCSRRPGLYR